MPLTKIELLEKHVNAEMQGDLETTMATMVDHPHLLHVPSMAGGFGFQEVRSFYKDHLVGKFFPPDVEFISVSRTMDERQLVEEQILKFTHTMVMDWMLPGIAPTGKKVEVAIVVIVKFEDHKIKHEHIYWDQASVLVQLGLLDPQKLPIHGAGAARKLQDFSL